MEKTLWDARPETRAYASFILTDSEEATLHVKSLREPSWAVMSCRIDRTIDSADEIAEYEDADRLIKASGAHGVDGLRYGKFVILRRRRSDDPALTVAFIRQWLPRLIAEERLFVTLIDKAIAEITYDDLVKAMASPFNN